jgi:hypothetical protein
MGAINVKHTGSGADISLSSDGTDLLLNGTAIGALELYAENPVTSTAPIATGDNAVAIGSGTNASGIKSLAFVEGTVTSVRGFSLGFASNVSGNNSVAMGAYSTASGDQSFAIGGSTSALAGNSVALGHLAQTASGAGSVAIGKSYASGIDSFAAAIASNSSSYGATGANSIAMGYLAKATGTKSVAIGESVVASATSAICIGEDASASAVNAIAIGDSCAATQQHSSALGTRSRTSSKGQFALGTGALVSAGFAQYDLLVIHGRSSDDTQGTLTSTSSLQGMAAGDNANQLIVQTYGAIIFDGLLVARGQGSIGNTDSAAWKIEGLIRKEANNASTVLVNSVITVVSNTPNWGLELAADTSNGALGVKVTGTAATNVKWVCTLRATETVYNSF